MYLDRPILSGLFKLAAGAAALTGVLLQCGVGSGFSNLVSLNYFTMLSNILCVVYFFASSFWQLRGKEFPFWRLKGPVLLCIIITGGVYHLMLRGFYSLEGMDSTAQFLFAFSNVLLHYVTPILMVLDWLIFDRKGRYPARDPFLWLLFPLSYAIYVNVREALSPVGVFFGGSHYPYFFMDVDLLGLETVLAIMAAMAVAFALLGNLLRWVDNRLARVSAGKGSD